MTTAPSPDVDAATGLRPGTFAIGTFATTTRDFPAVVGADGAVTDVSSLYRDTHAVFDDWDRAFDRLHAAWQEQTLSTVSLDQLRARPPLSHPNLMCAGSNYKQHVAEMLTKNTFNQHNRHAGESDEDFYRRNYAMMERRSREGTPFFWTGLHSSLVGVDDDIVLPVLGDEPDWELELAVVIARSERFVSVEDAPRLIAGYAMCNDLGTVDIFRRTDVPFGFDWVSKHQPTFKPMGPFIVPAQFFTLDEQIRIRLAVNGAVMQDWRADDLIFGPEQFVSYASERVRLLPGDVITMGSPPGNGKHHGRFLQDGDIVESSITYLGRQRNHCRAEQLDGRSVTFGHWTNI